MSTAKEAFLDLMADADWHIETDEGGTIHTIKIKGDQQLMALAKALGIETRWGETVEDAIGRAIDGGPSS